jgi:transcription elongation factor GreA
MSEGSELTQEGYDRLRAELERLETTERQAMADAILEARGHGDLSENAEYHAAKEEQGHLETRIARLRAELAGARVVAPPDAAGGAIGVGSQVRIRYVDDGETQTFQLVGSAESDAGAGRLSVESPFGRALIGRAVGDKVDVRTPGGEVQIEVVSVGADA